jgi:hypothetical protein
VNEAGQCQARTCRLSSAIVTTLSGTPAVFERRGKGAPSLGRCQICLRNVRDVSGMFRPTSPWAAHGPHRPKSLGKLSLFSRKPLAVDPTTHNTNHRDQVKVAAPDLDVPWTDGRQEPQTCGEHAQRTQRRHREDAAYHRSALRGLARGRAQRAWTDEAVLRAVREFRDRTDRWPGQHDFRSANGLPGLGTVWRRYGSHLTVVLQAQKRTGGGPGEPNLAEQLWHVEDISVSSRFPLGNLSGKPRFCLAWQRRPLLRLLGERCRLAQLVLSGASTTSRRSSASAT